jgi:hypothetical protein
MNLVEATQKSLEAAQLISDTANTYNMKAPSLPGVGIGLSPDSVKGYQLVFQLASERERDLVKELYPKLDLQEQPHIEITGEAFSLPSSAGRSNGNPHRCRPLKVGAYISPLHFPDGGGTLGCFVRKITNPQELFILSCTHVLASHNQSAVGDSIVQPGGSSLAQDGVATLDNFIPLSSTNNNGVTPLDAAIAKILCQDTLNITCNFHNPIKLIGDYAENELQELLNRKVYKIGSQTGRTYGSITLFNVSREITYEKMKCNYQNLISIESEDPNNLFSTYGDSGSLICDEDGYAVGLLIGGTRSGITYALPIEPILNRLGIQLILD